MESTGSLFSSLRVTQLHGLYVHTSTKCTAIVWVFVCLRWIQQHFNVCLISCMLGIFFSRGFKHITLCEVNSVGFRVNIFTTDKHLLQFYLDVIIYSCHWKDTLVTAVCMQALTLSLGSVNRMIRRHTAETTLALFKFKLY